MEWRRNGIVRSCNAEKQSSVAMEAFSSDRSVERRIRRVE